jgi:hypothetical protein
MKGAVAQRGSGDRQSGASIAGVYRDRGSPQSRGLLSGGSFGIYSRAGRRGDPAAVLFAGGIETSPDNENHEMLSSMLSR